MSLQKIFVIAVALTAAPAVLGYSPFSKSTFGPRGGGGIGGGGGGGLPPLRFGGGPPPPGSFGNGNITPGFGSGPPPGFGNGPPPGFAKGGLPFGAGPPPFGHFGGHPPLVDRLTHTHRNQFTPVFEWKEIDFLYPTERLHNQALASGDFVPHNNLPLGLGRSSDRIFLTLPRWKVGVPASLVWLPLPQPSVGSTSPPLIPYPNWAAHGDPQRPDCSLLMSVYRLWIDECDRLWVIDSGVVNATIAINQVCPPKIVAFDLRTDRKLFSYELPADQVRQDSLHSNIVVDVRHGQCAEAYAYVTDVWRYGVVVFSLADFRSWRTTHHLYLPTPHLSDYTLHGVNFQWTDGVFGLALSPINEYNDRLMFFHPMSSYTEFMVSTAVLRNETLWTVAGGAGTAKAFVAIGERGRKGQSSTSGLDRRRVMFFNLVHSDAVGCWNTKKPYSGGPGGGLDVVAQDNITLVFPNDMKVDHEERQHLWVLSNRLPIYLYSKLDYSQVNYRVLHLDTIQAVQGTACDPDDEDIQLQLAAKCRWSPPLSSDHPAALCA